MRPVLLAALVLSVVTGVTAPTGASAAALGTPCQPSGTWTQGELDVWFLDVEQGDAQFIVGPDGRTMLLDLGENVWNRTNGTNAQRVAQTIRDICDVPSGPVHLDYVLASHLHLDHIGYAGNPHDTTAYGNGIYELLDPAQLGFTVGTLVTRDAGYWADSNGDGDCEVGTNASPSADVVYTNAGTMSSTGRRWICWLYGPDGQPDRANIEGRVLTLSNDLTSWPSFDLGPGVTAEVLQANAKGVMQADGVTPVSGDHVDEPVPPSENDYSVAVKFTYGDYEYATAGDTDGEYDQSSFGYSYNDVETPLGPLFGNVETMRVNHHGSSHSTNAGYAADLAAETAVIQCGNNSYGHPAANVLTTLAEVVTDDGVGTDLYMTNNPCDPDVGTVAGAFNSNGDIHLVTTTAGAGYELRYDTGTNSYATRDDASEIGGSGGGGGTSSVTDLVLNEYVPDNATFASEWVELHNPTSADVDASGLLVDDIAGGGGSPQALPDGAVVPAGGHYVFDISGHLLNNGGDDVRLLTADGATVIDSHSYATSSDDLSWARGGDGAAWCGELATASRGAANPTCDGGSGGSTGTVEDLVINEYVPDNNSFASEWVELYNPTGSDVDASGLLLDDVADGGGAPQALPDGAVVPAGGHYVVDISGYLLNNSGDDVRLLSADGSSVIDSHSYGSSADDQSWHRAPDGGTWCGSHGTATRAASNPATC